jgi:hypothetical protein
MWKRKLSHMVFPLYILWCSLSIFYGGDDLAFIPLFGHNSNPRSYARDYAREANVEKEAEPHGVPSLYFMVFTLYILWWR